MSEVEFTREFLSQMSLEELQGLEADMRLQVQERGDRAFMSEETEDGIIGFGGFAVFVLGSYVCYLFAMPIRGFGSVLFSLIFTFGGGAVLSALAVKFAAHSVRSTTRFFVRHRDYLWYAVLIIGYTMTRLSSN